jgi:hypothetical protein
MKKVIYFLLAFMLISLVQLNAQDVFYVDYVSGNDEELGTEAQPWQSPNASKWTDGCTVKISGEVYAYELATLRGINVTLEGITEDAAIAALDDSEFEDPETISGFQLFNIGDNMDAATLTIKNLTIKNVRRSDINASGGMIFVGILGVLNLENAVLKNFESTIQSFGGAIQSAGKIYAKNTTFENNSCMYGGAVQIQESEDPVEGKFENCKFLNNKADVYSNGTPDGLTSYSQGGAVSLQAIKRGNFEFKNCYFSGNQSNKQLGGAMILSTVNNAENTNINFKVTGCTFTNNYTSHVGAAIALNGTPASGNLDITIANCIFYKNQAAGQHGIAIGGSGMGGATSKETLTGTHVYANNTFFRNSRSSESPYSASFLIGQKGCDLVFVNNILLEETWSGTQGITVEAGYEEVDGVRNPIYNYKSYAVKNNIFGRVGGSYYAYWDKGFRVESDNLENGNRYLSDAKDDVNWAISPEEKAIEVGLATELTVPENGNMPYLELIDKDGLAIDFGASSLMVKGVNVVPQTDITGFEIVGNYRDAGAFEYREDIGLKITEQKKQNFHPTLFSDQLIFSEEIASANLYNISGVCVLSVDNVSVVNTSYLAKGIYIVQVIDKSGKKIIQKVLKK